jgi:hypothetical protein
MTPNTFDIGHSGLVKGIPDQCRAHQREMKIVPARRPRGKPPKTGRWNRVLI